MLMMDKPDDAIATLLFDGAGYPPGVGFSLWTASLPYTATLPPGARAEDFPIRMEAWHVGAMLVVSGRVGAVNIERTAGQIARDGRDSIDFMMKLDGGWIGEFDGLHVAVPSGRVCVEDIGRPFSTIQPETRFILLSVPRATLALPEDGASARHGRVLDGVAGRLFADHLAALVRVLPETRVGDVPAVAATTLALARSCLERSAPRDAARSVLSLRQRVRNHVNAHLTDPELTPDRIAVALGITRSTLYRAFPSAGVAGYIQARRLEAIRALIEAPGETRSLMTLSAEFGFASHAHFTTAFGRRFGYAPSSLRRARAPARAREVSVEVFQDWQRDLDVTSRLRAGPVG
jgi:AraC-like DNA-binding protein